MPSSEGKHSVQGGLLPDDPDDAARRLRTRGGSVVGRQAAPLDPTGDSYHREPFVAELRAGKNTLVYNVHGYPTKVPHQAIQALIEHFTRPGDLVLDPFCGSGMTGVAAVTLGRRAILCDVAPAAVHVAYNYVTPFDANQFGDEAHRILKALEGEIAPIYETRCDRCGGLATIEYTVWSDVFECPSCGDEIVYWNSAVDHAKGSVRKTVPCGRCGTESSKRLLRWKRWTPVSTKYSCNGSCRRMVERSITAAERDLAARIEKEPISDWYPTTPFGRDREMWRRSHEVMGIKSVDGFYTRRNLRVLAALWRRIREVPGDRLRSALTFAFTATLNRASRRYQWNAKRPTNVQTGTLYISSISYEWNVLSLFRRKVRDITAYYRSASGCAGEAVIFRGSATELAGVAENSIDYVFTDPPFGSNIYYSDCALLWEAWLGEFTPVEQEILINRKKGHEEGGKSLEVYQSLMTASFRRIHQVLKPGRWASIVFHSSDPTIWRAIQKGLEDASLDVVATTAIDKGQPSIKGLKGLLGEEGVPAVDIVLHARKPRPTEGLTHRVEGETDIGQLVYDALRSHLASLSLRTENGRDGDSARERRTQYLHSLSVRTLLDRGIPFQEVSFEYVETLCRERFVLRDGCWYLPEDERGASKLSAQIDWLETTDE